MVKLCWLIERTEDMKRILTAILAIFILCGLSWGTASASTTVTIDGGKIVNNRTIVP